MDETPIIAKIQPNCDEFMQKLKAAKKAKGKTNQDIADATGIPLSNISKYLSGNLANPNIYNAAAVALYLEISIDEAFGIRQVYDNSDRITELEAKVHDLEKDLYYCLKDREHMEASLKSRKLIIAALFGTVILLVASLGFGVIYDSILPEEGFIHSEQIAGISVMLITVIVIAIAVTVSIIGSYLYKKEKR